MPQVPFSQLTGLSTFQELPYEEQAAVAKKYWQRSAAEEPQEPQAASTLKLEPDQQFPPSYHDQQYNDSLRLLNAKEKMKSATPLQARFLQQELADSSTAMVVRQSIKSGRMTQEEGVAFAEAKSQERAEETAALKKTASLFSPEVDEQMQPAWQALKESALNSGYFGEQRLAPTNNLSGPMGNALAGQESTAAQASRVNYEKYRNQMASDFKLQTDEVDDIVKHRMGLQKDLISRDALGQLHIKDELLIRGNDELQQAISKADLPDKVKSNLSIEAPIKLAKFKEGVIASVKQKHPELASGIKWDGDIEKDYQALTNTLNDTVTEQFGGGLAAYGKDRLNDLASLASAHEAPNGLGSTSPGTPAQELKDYAKKQQSVNQLSNFINQEKVKVLGVDAATIGSGIASGIESIAIGAATGGLGSTLITADRIAKAGTAGKILLGGMQRGLNTAPIAAIYGTEQGLDTYERTGNLKLSLLSAAIEGGVTTAFGVAKLGGAEDVGQRITTAASRQELGKSIAKSWGQFTLGVGKAVVPEIPEELAISALNDLYVESQLNPGMTVGDLKKNLYDTLVTTVAASAPAGALGSATEQGANLFKSTHEQTDDELHAFADALAIRNATQENLPPAEDAGGTIAAPSVAPKMSREDFTTAVAEEKTRLEAIEEPTEAEQGMLEVLQGTEEEIAEQFDVEITEEAPVSTGETAQPDLVTPSSDQEATEIAQAEAEGEVASVRRMYHGTRADWTVWDSEKAGGLINLAYSPEEAEGYASGEGGGRDTQIEPNLVDDAGTVWTPHSTGSSKGYTNSAGDAMSAHNAAEKYANDELTANYPNATVKSLLVKANNTLDLTTEDGASVVANLTYKTPQAQAVVEDTKRNKKFHWSSTKHEHSTKVWKNELIPQLKSLGYDSIKYSDDGHPTMAVFDADQIEQQNAPPTPKQDEQQNPQSQVPVPAVSVDTPSEAPAAPTPTSVAESAPAQVTLPSSVTPEAADRILGKMRDPDGSDYQYIPTLNNKEFESQFKKGFGWAKTQWGNKPYNQKDWESFDKNVQGKIPKYTALQPGKLSRDSAFFRGALAWGKEFNRAEYARQDALEAQKKAPKPNPKPAPEVAPTPAQVPKTREEKLTAFSDKLQEIFHMKLESTAPAAPTVEPNGQMTLFQDQQKGNALLSEQAYNSIALSELSSSLKGVQVTVTQTVVETGAKATYTIPASEIKKMKTAKSGYEALLDCIS